MSEAWRGCAAADMRPLERGCSAGAAQPACCLPCLLPACCLMRAAATPPSSQAQEAYQGTQRSVTVQGLAPSAQLIFCVKALCERGARAGSGMHAEGDVLPSQPP